MPTPTGGPVKNGSSRTAAGRLLCERPHRRHQHEDAPQPVDDRRDRGQQLGQERQRLAQPMPEHSSERKMAMPSAIGAGQQQGQTRRIQRAPDERAGRRTRPTPDPRCRRSRIPARTSRSRAATAATARSRSPTTRTTTATAATPGAELEAAGPRRLQRASPHDTLIVAERVHLELDDLGRQRRVAELGRELLAVGQRPLHEVHHDLALRLVLRVLVEQQPGERRNRIDALARRVGDRHAEVLRHVLHSRGGGRGDRLRCWRCTNSPSTFCTEP